MVKNPLADAGRRGTSDPWSGKTWHAVEQPRPCVTTPEPARLEPLLRNRRSHCSEEPAYRTWEEPPLALTREKPAPSNKDPVW